MNTPLRVLILEDRPADAEMIVHELRRAGFEPQWQRVETAGDYLAHLEPAPDIILADYTLPQFDALYALELLHNHGLDIPFIVVTGSISEEVAVDCMKRGATDYLLKDRLARLGRAVTQALEQKRLRAEKRQAEAALRESERRFRLLAEHATDMIVRHTPDGIYLYVSPASLPLLGYAPEELIGRSAYELFHAEDLKVAKARTNPAEVPDTYTITYRARHRNGQYLWLETTNRAVRDATTGTVLEIEAVSRDISARRQAEEQMRASLREKEVLLQEIHHRVKNNLQIISSLLHLQSGHVVDRRAQEVFKESQNRIQSMALVHERLYNAHDLGKISFPEYARNLANHLFRSYGINTDAIDLEIIAEEVALSIDTAVPCGLILNELLSNCLLHAFPAGHGRVGIDLYSAGDNKLTLAVRDNGVGLPTTMDYRQAKSLGWQLVNALAGQLGATIDVHSHRGTVVQIIFEAQRPKRGGENHVECTDPGR